MSVHRLTNVTSCSAKIFQTVIRDNRVVDYQHRGRGQPGRLRAAASPPILESRANVTDILNGRAAWNRNSAYLS